MDYISCINMFLFVYIQFILNAYLLINVNFYILFLKRNSRLMLKSVVLICTYYLHIFVNDKNIHTDYLRDVYYILTHNANY